MLHNAIPQFLGDLRLSPQMRAGGDQTDEQLLAAFVGQTRGRWRPWAKSNVDYERVTALEMEFAGIIRQESKELEDATRTAGQLDRPGAGRDRMTAALGRAEVREKRKQEIQTESRQG
jgi:hypothetical protein